MSCFLSADLLTWPGEDYKQVRKPVMLSVTHMHTHTGRCRCKLTNICPMSARIVAAAVNKNKKSTEEKRRCSDITFCNHLIQHPADSTDLFRSLEFT